MSLKPTPGMPASRRQGHPASRRSPVEEESCRLSTPSTRNLIDNCLAQYRKPFSVAQLAGLTGLSLPTVRKYLETLVTKGKVRILEPGIYRTVHSSQVSNSTLVSGQQWRYNLESANQILDQIAAGNNKGCRRIAVALGVSRQFVWMYLTALCSIGSVGMNETGYCVLRRDNLISLGSNREPGIITRLRAEHGITNGQNRGLK